MESNVTYLSDTDSFNRAELDQQLQRLLGARPFSDSPRLRRFLSFVVTKTADENPSVITSYEIAIDAFQRSTDFDPNDPYIRNIAVLVRKGLQDYYTDTVSEHANRARIRIEIPKGNYRAKFSIIEIGTVTTRNCCESRRSVGTTATQSGALNINDIATRTESCESAHCEKKCFTDGVIRKVPLLAVVPFLTFGNDETNTTEEGIGEILAAEIVAGISETKSYDVQSLINPKIFQQDTECKSTPSLINADYLLGGKYQIANGMILLNIELSENFNHSKDELPGKKTTIIFSEFLRLNLESFYLKADEQLKGISKRLKIELSHRVDISKEPLV